MEIWAWFVWFRIKNKTIVDQMDLNKQPTWTQCEILRDIDVKKNQTYENCFVLCNDCEW